MCFESAFPGGATPQVSNVNLNLGEANRPDRIAKGTLANPTADLWFDLDAFPPLPAGSFRFGNSGRNILDAPGFLGLNLSLYKNLEVTERGRLQFRWEVFNVFNHPNLGVPDVNVNAPNGGTVTSAKDSRVMQFGARFGF